MAPRKERHTCLACMGMVEEPKIAHGPNALCKSCFSDIPQLEKALKNLEGLNLNPTKKPLSSMNLRELQRQKTTMENDKSFRLAVKERLAEVYLLDQMGLIRKKQAGQ